MDNREIIVTGSTDPRFISPRSPLNEQKTHHNSGSIPNRGAGNDPKLFFFFFFFFLGGDSLSPPRLNIFTVGNMGVMICLGQGGLHSLSASSL